MLWTTSPGNRRNFSWHEHDLGTIWCLRWGGGGREASPSESYYMAKAPEKSHSLLFAQRFPKPRAPGLPAFPRCLKQLSGFNSNLGENVFTIRSTGASKFHGHWGTLQLNDLQWSQVSFELKCKTRNIARLNEVGFFISSDYNVFKVCSKIDSLCPLTCWLEWRCSRGKAEPRVGEETDWFEVTSPGAWGKFRTPNLLSANPENQTLWS